MKEAIRRMKEKSKWIKMKNNNNNNKRLHEWKMNEEENIKNKMNEWTRGKKKKNLEN